MAFSNYHTHSIYCDGKDTPEEMVQEAIALGCPELGFSGHGYLPCDTGYCMSPENTELYRRDVLELQQKYGDRIRILLGVEQDYFGVDDPARYEYVIGAVHNIPVGDKTPAVDENEKTLRTIVQEGFQGDWYACCEAYYALVGQVYEKTGCRIVAHFDLITKFNEGGRLFDTGHPRYRAAVQKALDSLIKAPVIFEINTGAIARGYRTTPYPENFILTELRRRNAKTILSSDCHNRKNLLLGFRELEHWATEKTL